MHLVLQQLTNGRASCSLNLVGLHDPPTALTQQLTFAGPTTPTAPETTDAAPASSAKSDGAPETADPRPTASHQAATSTPASSPTSPPVASASPVPNEEPTSDEEDSTGAQNLPDSTPTLPTGTAQELPPSPGATTSPHATEPSDPETDSQPASPSLSGESSLPAEHDESDEADHSSQSETGTAPGLAGIIASVLGAQPQPTSTPATTTTNALSILESAAQTFDGDIPQPTIANPSHQPQFEGPGSTPVPAPLPITLSDEGHEQTLQPLPESDGLYTMAPSNSVVIDHPGSNVAAEPSADGQSSAAHQPHAPVPTEPFTLTHDGYTQTVRPVRGSSGLYTVIGASGAVFSTAISSSDTGQLPGQGIHDDDGASTLPYYFTGPATFVAGGQTHTIAPVRSTSGVFVVDGSRTLTQVAPTSGRGPEESSRSQTAAESGSNTAPDDAEGHASTVASASGSLPPVVVGTHAPGQTSTPGNRGVATMAPPPENANGGAKVHWSWTVTLIFALATSLLMCI